MQKSMEEKKHVTSEEAIQMIKEHEGNVKIGHKRGRRK